MTTGSEDLSASGALRPLFRTVRRRTRARSKRVRYAAGMKTLILLASFAAAHAAASPCIDRINSYSTPIAKPEYGLVLGAGTGQLAYIGARHSSDPLDPQFAEIERQWNAQRPQVAFYEGPNRPVPKDRNEAIQQTGESGFVRWLAGRDGVPLARLEPDPKDETADLLQHFTPEQVGLFFSLREAARLRERRGMGEAEIARSIDGLLERAAGMGLGNITMVQRLSAAVRECKRVFAVVGRDHVAHQADALRCAVSGADLR